MTNVFERALSLELETDIPPCYIDEHETMFQENVLKIMHNLFAPSSVTLTEVLDV